MVIGLDKFSAYFEAYKDSYLIIGGTACDIIIEDAGFTPRATDDIDIVLIIEALSPAFVQQFWQFVKDAAYTLQQKGEEKSNCYRFAEPKNEGFPKQLELFCKVPDVIDANDGAHLTPIPVGEGLSSLSAILLNDDYYNYTIANCDIKDGVHFAKAHSLICLKAYAYLNNKERKAKGEKVREIDIKKHKHDVFRMVFMLAAADVFEVPSTLKVDLQEFADDIKEDLPVADIFKQNGFGNQNMQTIFNQFIQSFNLTA
jgi:hypothetical protein